ncbi:MAG: transporter [Holdemanella sp.]|nr:transporter [Holdemanella sp.]
MSQSRLKNSLTNMFFGSANWIVLLILGFVIRKIMINTIGVELLGVNGTLLDIISLLSIADLGIHTAIVYSYYEPVAKNDIKRITALTCYYKKIYLYLGLFIFGVGLCVMPFLHLIINTAKPVPYLYFYYLLMITNVAASYLLYYRITVLTASQKDYIRLRATVVFNSSKIILQGIFLLLFKSYGIFLLMNLLTTIACNVYVSHKAIKEYPYLDNQEELDEESKKSIFSNVKSVFLYKISNIILKGTDSSLISMLIGTVYVGFYSNYYLVSASINNILDLIFQATTASIGNLVALEDEEYRYNTFEFMQFISFCICAIAIPCVYLLVDDFIKVWLGADFIIPNLCVIGISINLYLCTVYLPVVTFREAVGLYRQTRYIMLAAAMINIVLSVLLSKTLGMAGILLATPVARLLTYIWYEPRLLYKQYFGRKVYTFFIRLFCNFIVMIAIIIIGKMTVSRLVVNSFGMLFVKAICTGLLCLLIVLLVYSRRPQFKSLMNQVTKLLKRG